MKYKVISIVAIIIAISLLLIMGQLKYPLEKSDQDILVSWLKTSLPNVLMDSEWDSMFHYRTDFEGEPGDIVTCTPGSGTQCPSSGINSTGLVLNTEAATTGNFADFDKSPLADSGLNWNKNQKMRLGFRVTSIASQTVYLIRGSWNLASPYYGFKIINGSLYGVSWDQTTESTVFLQTITANTSYIVEARFIPADKILFKVGIDTGLDKVDMVQKGTLNSNLPLFTEKFRRSFYNFRITTNENVGKGLIIAFFEYIQLK